MMATTISPPLPSPTSSPPVIDHPDVDDANCRLLGPFALVVQALMGILVLGTLVWKRQREKPRRPWKIWLLDITKQMLGQLFVHTLNVLLSNFVANVGSENPCSLYFLNILVDTTAGVAIIYATLRVTTHVLTTVLGLKGCVSGQYTDGTKRGRGKASRPRLSYWFKQLGMYFFALLIMKVVVTILFALFPFLFAFGRWLLGLFGEAKNVQVLFVMCIFPLMMNTLQFWLVDSLLRHNPNKSKYSTAAQQEGGGGPSLPPPTTDTTTHLIGGEEDDEEEEEDAEQAERVTPAAAYRYPPPTSSNGSSRRGSPSAATAAEATSQTVNQR